MKVTIEMDMTAEEARHLLGLPDLQPMQERLLAQLEKQMATNLAYLDPEMIVRSILPLGAQGFDRLQEILRAAAQTAMGSSEPEAPSEGRKKRRS